jgi:hypothetical protein
VNEKLRDPYIAGIIVGALLFVIYSGYERISWNRF